jgi:peptidyl-prolyl cis-trans isomerase D
MISWLQNQFQRHFRFVFFLLLAVVIVAFVFTIGAAPGIGRGERGTMAREFYGVNLGSSEDTDRLFGDANLSVLLQAGFQALDNVQLQEYALQRHAALHLADQLNLPRPTGAQLTEFIRGLRAFAGPEGEFDPSAYSRFRDMMRTNPQVGEARLARVIGDDFRYDQVQRLIGGPGYVLDDEVARQIGRADATWQINVAQLDYESFQPNLQPSDGELRAYFESNAFRYELPPHVRVAYVEFPASAYLNRVNVTPAEVRAYFEANPSRFPNPNQPAGATPAVGADDLDDSHFEAVRPQVENALRLEQARRLAARAASDLTVALFDERVTSENAVGALAARGLELRQAPPIARGSAPAFLGGNPQHTNEAFRLTQQRPISDALMTPQGAVILVWQETIPARPAEFAAVQDQVRQDFLDNQRRQRFLNVGRTLRERIAERVQQGEAFAQAAAAEAQANNVQLTTQSHGPFARREPPQEVPFPALNAMENLEQGQISEMVMAGNQGVIVHVASKSLPEISTNSPRFQEVRTQMAQFNSARNSDDILREMVRSELNRTESALR